MKFNKRIIASTALLIIAVCACNKSTTDNGTTTGGTSSYPSKTDSVYMPTDPAVAATIGFFQNAWVARTFVSPDTIAGTVPAGTASDSLTINLNSVVTKVSPYVYGNNSVLWMGQMVNQPNLMQYIKDLSPNIIRAPAGSVSDIYFFNGTDAAYKPATAPDSILDANGVLAPIGKWYGGNTASYTLALNNYYQLLAQTNSTGIITINYGYARYGRGANPVADAAHLAADWVRFDKGKTKFWEIGNETYGSWEAGYRIDTTKNKDGQPVILTGTLYGKHLGVFVDSMQAAAKQIGATIYIGATLYQEAPYNGAYNSIVTWNQGVLASVAATKADYYIVHNYFTAYNTNSPVTDILNTGSSVAPAVMNYVQQQIKSTGATVKPIALTEWNIQATGAKQNVSYIAGMHAAKTIGSIIKNQYGEASRWDLANGYANGDDHGMFNIGDEPNAPLWNPRPAFYYLYYFQKYFGDRMVTDTLRRALNNADLITYSSTFSSGQAGTIIINSGAFNHIVSIDFQHFPAGSKYYWYVLTGGSDNAPFSGQVFVNGTGPSSATGGPLNYASIKPYSAALKGTIKVSVPAMSVVYLVAEKK